MKKIGFLSIQVMSDETQTCEFHKPVRINGKMVISSEPIFLVSYGFDSFSTRGMSICRDCWEKLKTAIDSQNTPV